MLSIYNTIMVGGYYILIVCLIFVYD